MHGFLVNFKATHSTRTPSVDILGCFFCGFESFLKNVSGKFYPIVDVKSHMEPQLVAPNCFSTHTGKMALELWIGGDSALSSL